MHHRTMRKELSCQFVLGLLMASLLASLSGCAEAAAKSAQGRAVRYTIKKPGRVSAAVYDAEGRLVRELVRGEQLEAGEHTLHWDGLDRNGHPMAPGDYEWRVLRTPGFRAEYVTSLGINPDSAPYDKWVGNHHGAASVAVDESGMYVAATVTETAPVLLKQTLDGQKRLWTRGRGDVTTGRFQGGVSLASDGEGTFYMLQQNAYIQVIDAESGKRRATWDLLPEDDKRRKDGRMTHRRYNHGKGVSMIDLAARGETIVMSYHDKNVLRWLNPEDGSVTAEVRIDSPWGVAVDRNEQVYVISGKQVLGATPGGKTNVVAKEELVSPRRLAIDDTTGDFLVSELDPTHQVKRFSSAGELRATYGRRGGRQDGTYVPSNYLHITDICTDGKGGFLITEESPAPRRVAHFDDDGKLVDEWYGGQPYYAWGEPDPRNPLRAWFNPGGWLTLAEIDPETHTWRVLENYRQSRLGGGLVRTVTGHRGRWHVLYRDGQRYLVCEGVPQVLAHDDGELRAVCVVSNNGTVVERAQEMAGHDDAAGAFRWLDRDADGEPEAGEFTFAESRRVPSGRSVSDSFGVIGMASGRGEEGAYVRVTKTAVRWTEHGPMYPIGDEDGVNLRAGQVEVASPATTGGTRGACAFADEQGNVYAAYNTGNDRHGSSWPTVWGGRSRVAKWTPGGELRWQVGRHAIHGGLGGRPHTTPPGYLHVPAAIIGEIRNTIVMTDRVEWMGMVWTKDGLYAGDVLDGRVDDGLPDTVYYWWRTPDGREAIITSDNATGGAIMEADDGTVYFFTQGRNSVPVYRIHGWDDWRRLSGKIVLEQIPPHARGAGDGLKARYYRLGEKDRSEEVAELFEEEKPGFGDPVTVRTDRRIWHGIPRREPGGDAIIDGFGGGPTYNWSDGVKPLEQGAGGTGGLEAMSEPAKSFAVRWSGELEAPLSEPFTFSVYARGRVRLWVNGEQIIFGWNESRRRRESQPIQLEAGRRYSVQLDYRSSGMYPGCSLNWESPSLDRRRVPTRYLYPAEITITERPDARSASRRISAKTFDETNIETQDRRTYTRGLRQRGFGTTGAYLGFQRLDFADGRRRLRASAYGHPAGDGDFDVTLEFRLDGPDGPTIATLSMRGSGKGGGPWSVELAEPVSGIHDVYVVNTTPKRWHFLGLGWFSFE